MGTERPLTCALGDAENCQSRAVPRFVGHSLAFMTAGIVGVACFQQQNRDVGILSEATRYHRTGGTRTTNDEVVLLASSSTLTVSSSRSTPHLPVVICLASRIVIVDDRSWPFIADRCAVTPLAAIPLTRCNVDHVQMRRHPVVKAAQELGPTRRDVSHRDDGTARTP